MTPARGHTRRIAVGMIAAALGAGCGGTSHGAASPDTASRPIRVSTLARRTAAARTARVEIHSSESGPSWKSSHTTVNESNAAGSIDFGRRLASLIGRTRRRDGGYNLAEYRSIGDSKYTRDPSQTEPIKARPGRPWIKSSSDAGGLAQFGNGDVTKLLTEMERAGATVTRVGTARVRGVNVTHYRITRVSRVPAKLRARGYNNQSPTTNVWADAQHRVRRVTNTSHFPTNEDRVNFAIDLFDFGIPVTVHAPPANQITVAPPDSGVGLAKPAEPWKRVASGRAGAQRWTVYHRRLREGGACVAYSLDGPPPRDVGDHPAGSCWELVDQFSPLDLSLRILPNGAQLVLGPALPHLRNVTLHYDDGSTRTVTLRGGALAFSVTGNRVVVKLTPRIRGENWSCALDFHLGQGSYNCSGGDTPFPPGTTDTRPGT